MFWDDKYGSQGLSLDVSALLYPSLVSYYYVAAFFNGWLGRFLKCK